MNNKIYYLLITTLIFSFFPAISYSQTDSVDIFDLTLDELMNLEVDIASRNSQKISEAPAVVGIVTKKDIENMGVTSLVDVLKHIPAIEISMGVMGDYRLSIRGERKNGNVLMLIDGQPINDFYNGLSIYDLPTDFIERIEIIRGPGSALFGTNAVAGVINIISNKNNNSISTRGGNFMTYSGSLLLSKKIKNTTVSINGGYIVSDGANLTPRSDDKITEKTNRWLSDGLVKASITNKNLNISAFGLMRNQGAWVGPAFDVSPDSDLKSNWLIGEAAYNIDITKKISIQPKVYSQYLQHDYLIQEHPDGYINNNFVYTNGALTSEKYNGLKVGSELQLKLDLGKNFRLVGGGVFENLQLMDYNLERNYSLVGGEYFEELANYDSIEFGQKNKQRDIFAAFVQAEYRMKKVAITAGLRLDQYSDFGYSTSPRLGFVYNLADNFNIKVLHAQAFRAPLFIELYDNTNFSKDGITGNKDLMPEKVYSSEVAFEYSKSKFLIRTNFFYNNSFNLIGVLDVDGGGGRGYYENIGDMNSLGNETELIAILNSSFDFFVNFSNFYSLFTWSDEIIDNHNVISNFVNNSKYNNQIRNIPNIRANAGVNYKYSHYSIFGSVNFGSVAQNNARSYFEYDAHVTIPAYVLGNINLSYTVKRLKISLLANNLGLTRFSDPDATTNIDKMGPLGMAQPINTFMLKLSVNLNSKK